MVNSGILNGITNKKDAIAKMLEVLAEKGCGEKGVQYKMRTGRSTVSGTGVNRFPSCTARSAAWCRYPMTSCRCVCRQ